MNHDLHNYLLHLADNSLVLGHRNSEWTGHGPVLEQDIALSNIALDLIGQARHFYQYAADIAGNGATEDTLAYFRDANEYRNCLLVEQQNGHWGKTILRQFLFSAYQIELYNRLVAVDDKRLTAIAEKSVKEVAYHLRWSSEWVIRLGQGTGESHTRMTGALRELWPFTEELITAAPYEQNLAEQRMVVDVSTSADLWQKRVRTVLGQAALQIPVAEMRFGGKECKHGPELEQLLGEMQYLQRTYPGVEW